MVVEKEKCKERTNKYNNNDNKCTLKITQKTLFSIIEVCLQNVQFSNIIENTNVIWLMNVTLTLVLQVHLLSLLLYLFVLSLHFSFSTTKTNILFRP